MIDEVAESFDRRQRDCDRLRSSEHQSLPEDVQVVKTKTKRDLYDQLEDLQESIKRMELGREAPMPLAPSRRGRLAAGPLRRVTCARASLPRFPFTLRDSGRPKFDDMPEESQGEHVQQFIRHMDQDEFVDLFLHFRGKKLSRGGVERALETYYLAKKQKQHEKNLRLVSTLGRAGIGGPTWQTRAGQSIAQKTCPKCFGDWVNDATRCMLCGSRAEPVDKQPPWVEMVVDGVKWHMLERVRRPSPGNQSRRVPLALAGTCFSDVVPMYQRVSLREVVTKQDYDEPAFERKDNRPPKAEDQEAGQEFLVFHPTARTSMC